MKIKSVKSLKRMAAVLIAVLAFGSCNSNDQYSDLTSYIQVFFTEPALSTDEGRDSEIDLRMADLIDSAQKSVDVVIYELSVPSIYNAIIRAYKRGLDVRFVGDIDNIDVYCGYEALEKANVPMSLGNPTMIMHDKIIIVDECKLVIGSANYTDSGFNMSWENVIFMKSEELAAYYGNEVDAMFNHGLFGLDKNTDTFNLGNGQKFHNNYFAIGDEISDGTFIDNKNYAVIEILFPPYINGLLGRTGTGKTRDDGKKIFMPTGYDYEIPSFPDTLDEFISDSATDISYDWNTDGDKMLTANDRIIDVINSADTSIRVAMFSFTNRDIADAIIRKHLGDDDGDGVHEEGESDPVKVTMILDKSWHHGVNSESSNSNIYAMHQWFLEYGIDMRYDGNESLPVDNPTHGGKCHNKFAIVDGETDHGKVITGSFNFSSSAATDGNDENCAIIYNKTIAQFYTDQFDEQYELGQNPTTNVGGQTLPKGAEEGKYIAINEIHWAGSSDGTNENDLDDFIELKNLYSADINISGWQIKGCTQADANLISFLIPEDTIIPAGGHYVVYYSQFSDAYTYDDNFHEYVNMWLYSTGYEYVYLELKDCNKQIADTAGKMYVNDNDYPANYYSSEFAYDDGRRDGRNYYRGYSAKREMTFYTPRLYSQDPGVYMAPYAGDNGDIKKSMYRKYNTDGTAMTGTSSSAWETTSAPKNISDSYKDFTWATPGADDDNQ
jgi:phosphatidylserine/phosphatidylglycerophosphate/cardiolipin synthase-like enzyme